MEKEEKLNILKRVLKENGLSYEDEEIFGFFNEKRETQPELYNENVERYNYSEHVEYVIKKVNPLDFENALYAHSRNINTLLDWFMYENAGANPFVWENIGNPKFDIKESFIKARYREPANIDLKGRLFNGGDGNHRLATLIINCIMEFVKAKTDEERQQVISNYSMEIPVRFPIKILLCELLNDQWEKCCHFCKDSIYPEEVRDYRDSTFATKEESRCFVGYNEEEKTFSYDFNGEKFVGSEDELIDYLYEKQDRKEPIMQWFGDGFYYLSCNNSVFKSKDKEKINELLPKVTKAYNNGDFELMHFVEVKDVDNNTYDLEISQSFIEDRKEAQQVANKVQQVLLNNLNEPFFDKLEDSKMWKSDLKRRVEKEMITFCGFTLPKLTFSNLTKEEYLKAREIFDEITKLINNFQENANEIK